MPDQAIFNIDLFPRDFSIHRLFKPPSSNPLASIPATPDGAINKRTRHIIVERSVHTHIATNQEPVSLGERHARCTMPNHLPYLPGLASRTSGTCPDSHPNLRLNCTILSGRHALKHTFWAVTSCADRRTSYAALKLEILPSTVHR